MKKYDFSKQELRSIPIVEGSDEIELILIENYINELDSIPEHCQSLNISSNKISSFSRLNTKRYSLKYLDISMNRLIGLSGCEMLPNLKELNLSNNYLADDQLTFINKLTKLKYLNISNNNFKSNTITTVLNHILKLQKLVLSNNNYEVLEFNSHPCLSHLEIDMNKLKSLVFLGKCDKLIFINLTNNPLHDIISVENISNVEVLNLTENSITNPKFLTKLTSLKTLDLPHNNLSKYVEKLDMGFNNLGEFSLLERSSRLKHLNLENNKITEFSVKFSSNSLEFLNLSNNSLTNVNSLKHLVNLKNLDLSNNRLDSLYSVIHSIKELFKLEELNLSQNTFNKSFNFIYEDLDCVSKLGNQKDSDGFMNYRAYVIKHFQINLRVLDLICITQYEKGLIKTEEKEKQENLLTFNQVNSAEINIISDVRHLNDKDCKTSSLKRELNLETLKTDEDIKGYETEKEKTNKNTLKEVIKQDRIQPIRKTSNTKENHCQTIRVKERSPNIPLPVKNDFKIKHQNLKLNEKYRNVYVILKKTIAKLADPNGFIENLNLKLFFTDLQKYYKFIDNISYILSETEKLSFKTIFPNKIHINDFAKVMKSDNFNCIYEALLTTINNKSSNPYSHRPITKDSITVGNTYKNNDKCIVKETHGDTGKNITNSKTNIIKNPVYDKEKILNSNDLNFNYRLQSSKRSTREQLLPMKETDLQDEYDNPLMNFEMSSKNIKNNQNKKEIINDKNYKDDSFSRTKHRTPLLKNKECLIDNNRKKSKNEFNESFLFGSYSNKDTNSISNEDLLISLLQCVRIPVLPLRYSEYSKVFKYDLSESNKESKLLIQFFVQFNLNLIEIKKFYCLERQEKYFNSKDTEITEALLLFAITDENKSTNFYFQKKQSNFQLGLFDNPLKITDNLRENHLSLDIFIANSPCVVNINQVQIRNDFIKKNMHSNIFFDEVNDIYISYSCETIVHVYRVILRKNDSNLYI